MKNKLLLIASCIFLAAALVIAGTVAYLADTDEDVNVMVLGDVAIEQIEQERDENGNLVEFKQAKPAIPAVYNDGVGTLGWSADGEGVVVNGTEYKVFEKSAKNVIDKIVTVKNTGKNDAFFRTIVAIEVDNLEFDKLVHINYNGTDYELEALVDANDQPILVELDGVNYSILSFTGKKALPAGKISAPSLVQAFIDPTATKENLAPLGPLWEIKVLSQAVQAEGFSGADAALTAAFGALTADNVKVWFGESKAPTLVNSAAELQAALDKAVDGDVIVLGSDITGDVTATQKPDVKVTINGNGKKMAGVLTVDGKSATYLSAGLTIQDLNFVADSISADACIRLGNGTNATRYTCNVTVDGCTFDVPAAVGVKSYTGGDKNLVIKDSVATAKAHSLVQAKGIDGVLVENCKAYSKNGLNFNNSDNVSIIACTTDVQGYAVRFGESSGGVGAAEVYHIKDCVLKSACADGDAVIVLRGTADYSTLTLENTTLTGSLEITNTAKDAIVIEK